MTVADLKPGVVVRALKHIHLARKDPPIEPGMFGVVVDAHSKVRWLVGGTCTVFMDEVEVAK